MRLCDAIRKGCEGTYQIDDFKDMCGGFCSIGTGVYGAGFINIRGRGEDTFIPLINDFSLTLFPVLATQQKCPLCFYESRLINIISHLNYNKTGSYKGKHYWTREAIADWIELNFESGARLSEPEVREEEEVVCLTK